MENLDDSGESIYNTNQYNRFIKGAMAGGLSNRVSAKLFNDVFMDLVDIGLLQFDERQLVTESKVQREKDRIGKFLIGIPYIIKPTGCPNKLWIGIRQKIS